MNYGNNIVNILLVDSCNLSIKGWFWEFYQYVDYKGLFGLNVQGVLREDEGTGGAEDMEMKM